MPVKRRPVQVDPPGWNVSIRYTCPCGANIRLPHTAAGRKAKCKACGSIFQVPCQPAGDDLPAPLVKSKPPANPPAPDAAPPAPGAWLDELANQEPRAAGESRPELLDISESEYQAPRGRSPSARAEFDDATAYAPDEGPWILAPERSFLGDLVESFLLFLDPGNFIAFVFLVLVKLIFNSLPLFGCYGLLVLIGANGYIYAFFMALVRETATGEDQFPTVWYSDYWDDLVVPLIQYLGTRLFVMWPCVALAIYAWWEAGDIDWDVFNLTTVWEGQGLARATAIAYLIGSLLWPAVVLTVAIGGTLIGLWPHIVARTAIAAPLGYLTICVAIMAADALTALPTDPRFIASLGLGKWLSGWSLRIIGTVLGMFSSLLAMRVIGLYYRHFKRRLPWVAE